MVRMKHIGKERFSEEDGYHQIFECPKCGKKLRFRDKKLLIDCDCKPAIEEKSLVYKRIYFNMKETFGDSYPDKIESGICLEDGDTEKFEFHAKYHKCIRVWKVTGMQDRRLTWWISKANIIKTEKDREKEFTAIFDIEKGTLAMDRISGEPVILLNKVEDFALVEACYLDNNRKWLIYKNFRVPDEGEISDEKQEILVKNSEISG